MKFLAPLAVFFLGSASAFMHFGPPTEEEKKSDRFFECLHAIEYADANGDNRISKKELAHFVDTYSLGLYMESILVNGKLPNDITKMYDDLVTISDPPDGVTQIDVYGYKVSDLAVVAQSRLDALHAICESVAHAINDHGHQTEPPELIRLEVLLAEEENEDGGAE